MDGGYHGGHDLAEVNILPDMESDGAPRARARAGVPAGVLQDVRIAPFNDLPAVASILEREADRVAAILVEPVLGAGGVITPQKDYLAGLCELADNYGVLLIFDEVITLRLSSGGMQQAAGLRPDLTTLGKIIGGGLPVGAFGGRAEIMSRFDPERPQAVFHSGTFNAANVVMAAGLAALKALDQPAIDRINTLGDRLRKAFNEVFRHAGLRGQVTGIGSLNQIHWFDGPLNNARDSMRALTAAGELPGLLHLEMMNRGVYTAKRGMTAVSTPMTEQDIDKAAAAFAGALDLLKPYIAKKLPRLIDDR
jgi:glutamate-1-semialdehyde 2,1-aminomutase